MTSMPINTAYDLFIATPKLFINRVNPGKACTSLKNRNTRSTRSANKNDRSNATFGMKKTTNEGMDNMTRVPSNRFHPDRQYFFNPKTLSFTTISIIKIIVQATSNVLIRGEFTPLSCKKRRTEFKIITHRMAFSFKNKSRKNFILFVYCRIMVCIIVSTDSVSNSIG